MMSFDEWYYRHYGINTNDLTDEEYDTCWELYIEEYTNAIENKEV